MSDYAMQYYLNIADDEGLQYSVYEARLIWYRNWYRLNQSIGA